MPNDSTEEKENEEEIKKELQSIFEYSRDDISLWFSSVDSPTPTLDYNEEWLNLMEQELEGNNEEQRENSGGNITEAPCIPKQLTEEKENKIIEDLIDAMERAVPPIDLNNSDLQKVSLNMRLYPLREEKRIVKTKAFTKSLTVAFRPEVYNALKEMSDRKNISLGEHVRSIIDHALFDVQAEKGVYIPKAKPPCIDCEGLMRTKPDVLKHIGDMISSLRTIEHIVLKIGK